MVARIHPCVPLKLGQVTIHGRKSVAAQQYEHIKFVALFNNIWASSLGLSLRALINYTHWQIPCTVVSMLQLLHVNACT